MLQKASVRSFDHGTSRSERHMRFFDYRKIIYASKVKKSN